MKVENITENNGVVIRKEFSSIEVLIKVNGQWCGFPANEELLPMLHSAIGEYIAKSGDG